MILIQSKKILLIMYWHQLKTPGSSTAYKMITTSPFGWVTLYERLRVCKHES